MSMTPMTPDFKANLKTFWQRPEGKTGMLFLAATAIAGVYGFAVLLPWLIALFANTLYAVGLGLALFTVLYIITNTTFRSIVGNMFRLSMRWMTGIVVEIDPIGILKNSIDKMNEKNAELSKGIEGCAGAKKQLERTIDQNNAAITHAQSVREEAGRKLTATKDSMMIASLQLRQQSQLQEIGRKIHSNENLQKILDQTTRMYKMLTRWQQLAEFNIENATAEMQNLQAERTAILASFKALGPAQRLIKGDPEQLKMVNQSIEFLAEDNANKLGAMEDFARYSEKFLTQMDLESGASAHDAEKMLAEYEQKLLTAGSSPTVPQQSVPTKSADYDYSK
jgi:hypothetical protein